MSDHSSAYLFGELFRELARDDFDRDDFARKLWKHMEGLDFHWAEMHADTALKKFGLARKRIDPDNPEDGKVWFYGPKGEDRT